MVGYAVENIHGNEVALTPMYGKTEEERASDSPSTIANSIQTAIHSP